MNPNTPNHMNKYRAIWSLDENNNYPFFLYIASLLDFIEYDTGGCLTIIGLNTLKMDISPYIQQFQTENPKITQKNLVYFLLSLTISYTTLVLAKQIFELSKAHPDTFFSKYKIPSDIKADFEKLETKATELIPKLKIVLETYFGYIKENYYNSFLEQTTLSFVKPVYASTWHSSLDIVPHFKKY